VTASPEQLRAQLELAHLQEVPAEPAPLDASAAPVAPEQPQATQPAPDTVLRYRW